MLRTVLFRKLKSPQEKLDWLENDRSLHSIDKLVLATIFDEYLNINSIKILMKPPGNDSIFLFQVLVFDRAY